MSVLDKTNGWAEEYNLALSYLKENGFGHKPTHIYLSMEAVIHLLICYKMETVNAIEKELEEKENGNN
jgi:hypothetical protein